jgi:hypothetical protein
MNLRQLRMVTALGRVRLPLGPRTDRRFITDMHRSAIPIADRVLSLRQAAYVLRLVHRYRRQLDTHTLELALDEADHLAELHPEIFDRGSSTAETRRVQQSIQKVKAEPRCSQLDLFALAHA